MLRQPKRQSVTLTVIAALAGALTAGPATAATAADMRTPNGQMVETCVAGGHTDIKSFIINGLNQNDDFVVSPRRPLEGDRNATRCSTVGGMFWKGTIYVSFWDDNDINLGTRKCEVPVSQPQSTYTCTFL
ncbi:hypothetical protein ABZ912_49050 [Nonomuraea angiospora]|uniref:hypothetical protein n=1 Tax=Nonomuraea angiospora TaxID=46172 RepID=UPI0033D34C80